jgi:hypothetical protein
LAKYVKCSPIRASEAKPNSGTFGQAAGVFHAPDIAEERVDIIDRHVFHT